MPIGAGELDQRITFLREATEADEPVADGQGGYALQWIPVATVWAKVRALSTREALAAAQLESSVSYEIKIRYRPGLSAAMCVEWRGQRLNLRGAMPMPVNDMITLLAEAGVPT